MNKFLVYTDTEGYAAVVVPKTPLPNESAADFLTRLAHIEIANGRVASDIRIVEGDPRPASRTFHNAWTFRGNSVEVDMPKARAIHMDRIREVRDEKLKGLDKDWMKAQGQKQPSEAIEAKRQKLRDIPQTLDLESAKTPEQLEKLWPAELND